MPVRCHGLIPVMAEAAGMKPLYELDLLSTERFLGAEALRDSLGQEAAVLELALGVYGCPFQAQPLASLLRRLRSAAAIRKLRSVAA